VNKHWYISEYCSIRNGIVSKNGEPYYKDNSANTIKEFAKGVYKYMNLAYSKFHKMDELCKLSFLAAEVLLADFKSIPEDTALVLSNAASSLETDRKHQQSINGDEKFASPAVFVYTLPNIMMGEISIRHQLKSENAFFVSQKFDTSFIDTYSRILLDTGKASSVICGWVDLDSNKYDVFLAFVAAEGKEILTKEQLDNFYKN